MHLSTILLLITIVISFILSIIVDAYKKKFSVISVIGYLFAIFAYYLVLLDQECVHNGPCSVWGWIRFVLIALGLGTFVTYKMIEVKDVATGKTATSDKAEEQTVEQLQSF